MPPGSGPARSLPWRCLVCGIWGDLVFSDLVSQPRKVGHFSGQDHLLFRNDTVVHPLQGRQDPGRFRVVVFYVRQLFRRGLFQAVQVPVFPGQAFRISARGLHRESGPRSRRGPDTGGGARNRDLDVVMAGCAGLPGTRFPSSNHGRLGTCGRQVLGLAALPWGGPGSFRLICLVRAGEQEKSTKGGQDNDDNDGTGDNGHWLHSKPSEGNSITLMKQTPSTAPMIILTAISAGWGLETGYVASGSSRTGTYLPQA